MSSARREPAPWPRWTRRVTSPARRWPGELRSSKPTAASGSSSDQAGGGSRSQRQAPAVERVPELPVAVERERNRQREQGERQDDPPQNPENGEDDEEDERERERPTRRRGRAAAGCAGERRVDPGSLRVTARTAREPRPGEEPVQGSSRGRARRCPRRSR